MFLRTMLALTPVMLFVARGHGQPDSDHNLPVVVTLDKMQAGQWVEKVWGDPNKSGEVFAIRIHNDAGYIAMPHVHPMDEHIVVVQGAWWFGMGSRFDRAALKKIELGAFSIGPKNMPHFGWSEVEMTIHVYGVGPFATKLIDPVYELRGEGTFLLTSLFERGTPTNSTPTDCFALQVGARVTGAKGEGSVIAVRCSPANHITQYWIQKTNGERFWATLQELKPM